MTVDDELRAHTDVYGAKCACGHLVVVHTLTNGRRRACTHADAAGPCQCPSPR